MKRLKLSVLAILCTLSAMAQKPEFFVPYQQTDLRLPAVPLILNDPYISFWSPYNKLTDGTTRHWTDREKPIDGLLRVDGVTYRFMGKQQTLLLANPLVPMTTSAGSWEGKALITNDDFSNTDWTKEDFDDSAWETKKGAFGNKEGDHINIGTTWEAAGSHVFVRRHFNITADDLGKDLWLKYSHDDYCWIYINGHAVVNTGYTWVMNETKQLTSRQIKNYLHEGDNVIAVHCKNQQGGAYLDFGLYENVVTEKPAEKIAVQNSVNVLATNTYYNFTCGKVKLDLVFTAPMVMDDLDLISTPVNYISYQVTATDGIDHDVQIMFGFSPELTVHDMYTQNVRAEVTNTNDISYLKCGRQIQDVLKRVGDLVAIDWGWMYIPNVNGETAWAPFGTAQGDFSTNGKITNPITKTTRNIPYTEFPTATYVHDFGQTQQASSYMMFGYDEVKDIKLWGTDYKGYWARNGKTIQEAFEDYRDHYDEYMTRAQAQDKIIYDDAMACGNKKYAELLSGTYRQVLAAHKLFLDQDGDLMYFSKENDSNGCVNTVDLTYPSAPLFLTYNPELEKGMITSIMKYSWNNNQWQSRWNFDFAAHDLGTYPHANGNVYGNPSANDGSTMPLEENANIITLAAFIAKEDGDLEYIKRFWPVLTRWKKYLVDNGKEPGSQLCTDDFKGHSSRNANLAVKAIMGIAAYAELCKMMGDEDGYKEHMAIASEYAHYWVDMDRSADGKWYYMEFENSNHWGLKYNMLWDKLWGWNIFNDEYTGDVIATDIAYYKTKIKTWGLPLDSRDATGKSDWVAWTAAMTETPEDFATLMDPEWKWANETTTRWPLSDWHWTDSKEVRGFRARSVIGGLWAQVLRHKVNIAGTPGDANNDGNVTVADLTMIASCILGTTPEGFNQANADINKDGIVSVADLTMIANIILGGK